MGSHKFICHRDYTGVIAGGNKKEYSFHRGEEYDTIGPFIATKFVSRPVRLVTSTLQSMMMVWV